METTDGQRRDQPTSRGGRESMEWTYLRDKTRENENLLKQMSIKLVLRRGVTAPSPEEIESIRENRTKYLNMVALQKRIVSRERNKEEFEDFLSYDIKGNGPLQQSALSSVETTSLEGRAVILSPLLAMFRMLLCDNRSKKRLERLEKKYTTFVPEVPLTPCEHQTIVEASSVVAEHLSTLPVYGNRHAAHPNLFLMTDSFAVRPLREPFVFLSRQYQVERIPEFALNLTKESIAEYASYKMSNYTEPSAVTLSNFVQPVITLETFNVPEIAYDTFLKRDDVLGYESFSGVSQLEQLFNVKGKEGDVVTLETNAVEDGLLQELNYIGMPSKLNGPLPEDSMSDSEDEDEKLPFRADVSWLPALPPVKKSEKNEAI